VSVVLVRELKCPLTEPFVERCIGGLENEELLCRTTCSKFGVVAVNVDYRLGPEYKFPTAQHDSYDATKWVSNVVLFRPRSLIDVFNCRPSRTLLPWEPILPKASSLVAPQLVVTSQRWCRFSLVMTSCRRPLRVRC
jgi:hypothetical protein